MGDFTNKRGGEPQEVLATVDGKGSSDVKKMRITRKDVERQRRQHMTNLCASLRSQLPLESIEGKGAVSDQMSEAVNYIKQQEKKIQDLSVKRDKLKRFSNPNPGNASSQNCSMKCVVTVRPYNWGGVEIVINSGLSQEGPNLSTLLQVMLEEGLDVARCVSTRTNEGFLHTIQCEVAAGDPSSVDLPGLQQRLNDLIIMSFI